MQTLFLIGQIIGWALIVLIAVYAAYGVCFGIAAAFARPGGEV